MPLGEKCRFRWQVRSGGGPFVRRLVLTTNLAAHRSGRIIAKRDKMTNVKRNYKALMLLEKLIGEIDVIVIDLGVHGVTGAKQQCPRARARLSVISPQAQRGWSDRGRPPLWPLLWVMASSPRRS